MTSKGRRRSSIILIALALTVRSSLAGNTYCVWTNSLVDGPGTAWSNAFRTIQGAVNAATNAGDVVLVTNGIYRSGGISWKGVTNRVTVTNAIIVRSVRGPTNTFIVGNGPRGPGAVRCAYLANGASLVGFTLTNGATALTASPDNEAMAGGGVLCGAYEVISNCVVTGNRAGFGGGAGRGTLINCTLSHNRAEIGSSLGGGGGAYSSVLSNCVLFGNATMYKGGGACWGTLYGSVLYTNTAPDGGGGAALATLDSCIVSNCSAYGVYSCTVSNSLLAFNDGGSYDSTLVGCTVVSNRSGGILSGSAVRCLILGNQGGAQSANLNTCVIMGNTGDQGAGALSSTLRNCTVIGNRATKYGGGVDGCSVYGTILFNNEAPYAANHINSTIDYSCTTPMPDDGAGNTTADPGIAGIRNWRLVAGSPCIDADGPLASGIAVDYDGEPRTNNLAVDMGADELWSGLATGGLTVAVSAPFGTSVTEGCGLELRADIGGRPTGFTWRFGDGTTVRDTTVVFPSYQGAGTRSVVLEAVNASTMAAATVQVSVASAASQTRYVATNGSDAAAGTSWATAKKTIQAAVNDLQIPGGLVLVSNGVYATGGTWAADLTNRVAVTRPICVRSVNGAAATIVRGQGPMAKTSGIRCVYLTNGASIVGFTLTNGVTGEAGWSTDLGMSGGGVCGESERAVASNCVISGNTSAQGSASRCRLFNCSVLGDSCGAFRARLDGCRVSGNVGGGGAMESRLECCLVADNSSFGEGGGLAYGVARDSVFVGNTAGLGGGACQSRLYGCTLVENRVMEMGLGEPAMGGGASDCTMSDCILWQNWADTTDGPMEMNWFFTSTWLPIDHTCSTPKPPGNGSIDQDPLFVNAAAGDYTLSSGSPCVNAGRVLGWMPPASDLAGNPRISGTNVDMGSYELPFPQSDVDGDTLPDWWEWRHAMTSTGMVADADADGDRFSNVSEFLAGTHPCDGNSRLAFEEMRSVTGATNAVLRWQSVSNRHYRLLRGTNLLGAGVFDIIVRTNIAATPPMNTETDKTVVGKGPWFYRLRLE